MSGAGGIHWFPGHMAKTLRLIEAELKNVDLVIELIDARIPKSSKNPELTRLAKGKPSVLLLGKADLAEEEITAEWTAYYRALGYAAFSMSAKESGTRRLAAEAAGAAMGERMRIFAARGRPGRRLRAMVVGTPNVGKSTFINALARRASAPAADRPGVTRGKQWVSAESMDLLDMPGVLWPKFEDAKTAEKLAFTGAVRDDVLNMTGLAASLLREIKVRCRGAITERYKIDCPLPADEYELLRQIALKRGMLIRGGEADIDRAAIMLIDELRGCRIGRISFERPSEAF